MNRRPLIVLALMASALGSPAAALANVERLNAYLNGTDDQKMMAFSFDLDDCTIVSGVTLQRDEGSVQNLLRTIAISDLDLDTAETRDMPGLGVARIFLSPRDGAPVVTLVDTMTTSNADVRAVYAANGAGCEDTTCTLQATESRFGMPVSGPEATLRAETVLADLRELQFECAQTQEGTN